MVTVTQIEIRLIDASDLLTIVPLLRVLNDQIPAEILSQRLVEMREQGYRCAGAYRGDKLVGICGIWILTKYYVGRHIQPDNVMILPSYRSQGIGQKLLNWVEEYGRQQGCDASELDCYLPNKNGQKFWKNQGFEVIGYHYYKDLSR